MTAASSGLRTCTDHLTTGRNRACWSISWLESRNMSFIMGAPVMTSTGLCAWKALATPVNRLVAPGPLVAMHTPGRPATLA